MARTSWIGVPLSYRAIRLVAWNRQWIARPKACLLYLVLRCMSSTRVAASCDLGMQAEGQHPGALKWLGMVGFLQVFYQVSSDFFAYDACLHRPQGGQRPQKR